MVWMHVVSVDFVCSVKLFNQVCCLCNVGPGFNKFSLEVHHGGSFCGRGANRTYVDGKVTWYDNLEVEFWCYVWIEDLVL